MPSAAKYEQQRAALQQRPAGRARHAAQRQQDQQRAHHDRLHQHDHEHDLTRGEGAVVAELRVGRGLRERAPLVEVEEERRVVGRGPELQGMARVELLELAARPAQDPRRQAARRADRVAATARSPRASAKASTFATSSAVKGSFLTSVCVSGSPPGEANTITCRAGSLDAAALERPAHDRGEPQRVARRLLLRVQIAHRHREDAVRPQVAQIVGDGVARVEEALREHVGAGRERRQGIDAVDLDQVVAGVAAAQEAAPFRHHGLDTADGSGCRRSTPGTARGRRAPSSG